MSESNFTVYLYMDENGDFTFEIHDLSGKILAESSCSYSDEKKALSTVRGLGITPDKCVVKLQDWDPWTQCELWNIYSAKW